MRSIPTDRRLNVWENRTSQKTGWSSEKGTNAGNRKVVSTLRQASSSVVVVHVPSGPRRTDRRLCAVTNSGPGRRNEYPSPTRRHATRSESHLLAPDARLTEP